MSTTPHLVSPTVVEAARDSLGKLGALRLRQPMRPARFLATNSTSPLRRVRPRLALTFGFHRGRPCQRQSFGIG